MLVLGDLQIAIVLDYLQHPESNRQERAADNGDNAQSHEPALEAAAIGEGSGGRDHRRFTTVFSGSMTGAPGGCG
jgi:hypothetical protein